MSRKICLVGAVMVLVLGVAETCVADIFFSEASPGRIRRASDDGSSVQTIVSFAATDQLAGIALDVPNGHLYTAVQAGDDRGLYRVNLDGTNLVKLVTDYVTDVELDLMHGKVYWSNSAQANPGYRHIRRANLDGSNVETLVTLGWYYEVFCQGIALDPAAGKLYYSNHRYSSRTEVRGANLDGSGDIFLTELRQDLNAGDLEIDVPGGKLYALEIGGRILKLNLDGTGMETVLESPGLLWGLALDGANHVYYSYVTATGEPQIRRANTDGTDQQLVLTNATGSWYLEYAPGANAVPVADAGPDQTVNCGPQANVSVTLDGTASSDPDGDTLEYVWTVPAGSLVTLANPTSAVTTATIPATESGDYPILLTVTDGKGGTSTDEVVIHVVVDSTPPEITCETDKVSLWPPDHRIVEVTLAVSISDGNVTAACTSSEPDDANGDGEFTGDVNGGDGFSAPQPIALSYNDTLGCYVGTLRLRAERDGREAGRTYSIVCTATDPYGNSSTARCAVVVPHDRRRN
jgi:hypothetical protein